MNQEQLDRAALQLLLASRIQNFNVLRWDRPRYVPNLCGADFSGVNLRNAYLAYAKLRWVSFRNANLRHANLREADLRDANFSGTDLRRIKVNYKTIGLPVVEEWALEVPW